MSQNVEIDESMIIAVRHIGSRPSTRFIQLDRMPYDEHEVSELHQALIACTDGQLANDWGEVSHWPAERLEVGDWTPAIWRSAQLAEAAARFAEDMQFAAYGTSRPVASGDRTTPSWLIRARSRRDSGQFSNTKIQGNRWPNPDTKPARRALDPEG